MNLTIGLTEYIVAGVALLIGIWLGMLFRSGAKRRSIVYGERLRVVEAEREALFRERDALRTERDALDQRLTPLAAEVDRLKRADAKRTAIGAQAPVDTAADLPSTEALEPNDVRRLKGVGDRFAAALSKLGITGIDQISGWSGADADVIDSQLGAFSGRIRTDRLVEQARLLHEGRTTEYETRFGAL